MNIILAASQKPKIKASMVVLPAGQSIHLAAQLIKMHIQKGHKFVSISKMYISDLSGIVPRLDE